MAQRIVPWIPAWTNPALPPPTVFSIHEQLAAVPLTPQHRNLLSSAIQTTALRAFIFQFSHFGVRKKTTKKNQKKTQHQP